MVIDETCLASVIVGETRYFYDESNVWTETSDGCLTIVSPTEDVRTAIDVDRNVEAPWAKPYCASCDNDGLVNAHGYCEACAEKSEHKPSNTLDGSWA